MGLGQSKPNVYENTGVQVFKDGKPLFLEGEDHGDPACYNLVVKPDKWKGNRVGGTELIFSKGSSTQPTAPDEKVCIFAGNNCDDYELIAELLEPTTFNLEQLWKTEDGYIEYMAEQKQLYGDKIDMPDPLPESRQWSHSIRSVRIIPRTEMVNGKEQETSCFYKPNFFNQKTLDQHRPVNKEVELKRRYYKLIKSGDMDVEVSSRQWPEWQEKDTRMVLYFFTDAVMPNYGDEGNPEQPP